MADHPSGSQPAGYDEKKEYIPANPPKVQDEDEEEDADMDALIDELESHDGGAGGEEFQEGQEDEEGNIRQVPDDLLQTSTVSGLTEEEVLARRKKYGLNAMKEERVSGSSSNLFDGLRGCRRLTATANRKTWSSSSSVSSSVPFSSSWRLPPFLRLVSRTGSISVSFAVSCS